MLGSVWGTSSVWVTGLVCVAVGVAKASTVARTLAAIAASTSGVALEVGSGRAACIAACTVASMSGVDSDVGVRPQPRAVINIKVDRASPSGGVRNSGFSNVWVSLRTALSEC